MATVNIRRDVKDGFYRYKMPVLQTKIEGKGNGIKTVVPNMADVARALNRPASYPTKFFGCELGAQATFNDATERYIVNGAHDANRLRELLDAFIDKFVLCPSCKNPETELILTKADDIYRDCKACGKRGPVDMRHRLSTFILKNPPKKSRSRKGAAGADSLSNNTGAPAEDDEGEGTDDELTRKIEAGAADTAAAVVTADDDDWAIDTSQAAVEARMQAMSSNLQSSLLLTGGDDDSAFNTFGEWIKAGGVTENSAETGDSADTPAAPPTDAEIYKKADELDIADNHKTLVVLVQALFTKDILTEIPQHLPLLTKLTTSEKHQKSLLGGLERFLGEQHPDLIPQTPKILMELYQNDILEEDLLKDWGTHISKKYVSKDVSKKVRKAAGPFIKWLDEAESDDDDDEDDE